MAEASGWGVLPLSVSFSGIYKDLQKQLVEPATKAGKTAGQAVASEMKSGAEAAAKAVESAQYRQKKSSEELRAAESKLTEQKLKSEAANQAVEAAARKRADAESKGIDAIERAEQDLLKKRANAEKAARDMASAEQKVEDALGKSARAAENLEQKQKALDSAQDDTEQSAGKLSGRLKEMGDEADSAGGLFDGLTGKVGGFVGAFAGIAGVGALFAEGMDVSGQVDKMNRQLGLVGDEAEQMGADVTAVMKSGWGSEEAVSAIGSLTSQFDNLGQNGEQTAQELSDNFLAFTDTFEVDMAEATQTAGQLIVNGLATDTEHAADLMTAAMQKVPAAMRDELPEIMNEYGTNFANLGLSGEEAFGLLVAQADKGKFALDKTGDALKEFTIRGSDMSEASADAFGAVGLNAEDMARKIAEGGDAGREALEETAKGLLGIEDPAERANTAIALFGAPMEDMGVDQIPQFLEGLTDLEGGMGDVGGASQGLADEIGNSLEGRMATLKGTVSALATEGFMWLWDVAENKVIPILKDVGTWIQDNEKWIAPLAATIGGAAAAWGLWTAAVKGWEFATKVATGVQMAFNLVMNANPIMLIVTALAAVTAGLIYFFTQTETGREMWSKFTTALADGWDWVTEKLSAGWAWIQENVFNAFGRKIAELEIWWQNTTGKLAADWQATKDMFSAIWEAIKTAVFDAWNAYVDRVRENWRIVTEALSAAWTWVKDTFSSVWNTIKTAVFDAWNNYVNQVKANWDTVTGALNSAWTALKDHFTSIWNTIKTSVLDAWNTAVNFLRDTFNTITTTISDKWTWLKDQMGNVWNWIRDNVFTKFEQGLEGLKSFFSGIVDGIRDTWNKLRGYLAKPINFMIGTVYGGIASAWAAVADVLPIEPKQMPSISKIPEYAVGGGVHGPGTGTSDDILAKLSNGEHVWTAREVSEAGGQRNVYAMRHLVAQGQPFTFDGRGSLTPLPRNPDNRAGDLAGAAPDLLPRFATGGEVRPLWETQLERAHEFASAQHGKPYQWAGPTGPETSFDCSGYMGSIAAVLQDTSPWQRYWATGSFAGGNTAQGFVPGLGPGFSIGLFNGGPYGGHTAGTLGAAGNYSTTNVESGGSPSMVKYGPGAVGADHSQFTHQYHLPIGADGAFESGGAGGFDFMGAVSKWITDKMGSILDPIVDKLPSPPPAWQDIPRGFFEKGKDSLFGFVEEKIENLGHLVSGVWGKITNLFDTGGMLQSGRMAMNLSGKPERILSPSQTMGFDNLVRNLPLITESMAVIAKEIGTAFNGGDWGMGELASVLGDEKLAESIINGAAALGTISRAVGEQAQKSGEEYVTEQATGALDVMGLGGLVPLGMNVGQRVADLAELSPVQAHVTPNGVVVEIDAEGGDFVHVDQVRQLADRVHGLEVKVTERKKPLAAAVTRGGAM